ncbi:dethiobiotin synthase [Flavobacteriaceae bacterium]|nr:dethiobiotin synthase [Flavobacteriaceae bacterium]
MDNQLVFVTGISTEVGKTFLSAVITEALEADYWKPIQAGELEFSDKDTVQSLVSNSKSKFYPIQYELNTPMSPHAAAEIDGVTIDIDSLHIPKTANKLVIEGAGGLLVPLNNHDTILDIIPKNAKVIVVSRHYLGSINHTLMTLELLKINGFQPGIIFNGDEHPTTESIIASKSDCFVIGRVGNESEVNVSTVKKLSKQLKNSLLSFLSV